MKKLIFILLSFLIYIITPSAKSIQLRDYTPYKYEVLFTNPICKTYSYKTPLRNQQGQKVFSKSKNAYCKSSDSIKSGSRKNAPLKRLLEWIKAPTTKEVFLAYLSFSQRKIAKALCDGIEKRNLKVTLIIDKKNESEPSRMATAKKLSRCRPKNLSNGQRANYPKVVTSGHTGGLGYAHNKLIVINPAHSRKVQIGFSSGNMSSGTVTHHENWHFVTTSPLSYFAQIHRCLMTGISERDQSKKIYAHFIQKCRRSIKAPEESDIRVFLIPGNGKQALQTIATAIKKSQKISLAAHRFSYGALISLLKKGISARKQVQLILDDDIYWSGIYKRSMGRNTIQEYKKVNLLGQAGAQIKFIETYADRVKNPISLQLQHNKFLIFKFNERQGAVFTGAGNLTGAAFTRNFENFYFIRIPEVYEAFQEQYALMWTKLAKSFKKMPTKLVLP